MKTLQAETKIKQYSCPYLFIRYPPAYKLKILPNEPKNAKNPTIVPRTYFGTFLVK